MTISAPVPVSEPRTLLEPLRNRLAELAARPSDREFAVVEIAVPARRAEALVDLEPAGEACYFAEPNGYEHVGLGAVRRIEARGPERFRAVTAEIEALFASLGADAEKIRLFGGFAFQTGRAASASWRALGEARFVLPRVTYERTGDSARLLVVLTASELADAAERERALGLAERALEAQTRRIDEPHLVPAPLRLEERAEQQYLALVDQVRAAIAKGELEKVVLARRVEVALPRRVTAAQVLSRLSGIAAECLRFAFRVGDTTFLGATPERLVEKRGRRFMTEAVAGSIKSGEAASQRLLESSKDRAEQAIVVRELLHVLEPLAAELEHERLPEVQRLRHVAHLRTKMKGLLREPLHVLSLVERLHPTPAVGGVPSARALAFIAEHEPDERGWYAGPIGWVDSKGDGSFAVALRSGILEPERAALYAGGGIMQGSDASSELTETRWKLQALLGALGVAS
jgi:isochorismate synthase